MPAIPAFHSVNELKKPLDKRVHHDNSTCIQGRQIARDERVPGTGGYPLCEECAQKAKHGR
jgi:hypothetical protein